MNFEPIPGFQVSFSLIHHTSVISHQPSALFSLQLLYFLTQLLHLILQSIPFLFRDHESTFTLSTIIFHIRSLTLSWDIAPITLSLLHFGYKTPTRYSHSHKHDYWRNRSIPTQFRTSESTHSVMKMTMEWP